MGVENEKEYLKLTKKIYKQHRGQLIFYVCYHFSWDAKKARAESFVYEKSKKCYKCCHCDDSISSQSKKKIEELVKYLNDGGRDDKVMTKLYKGVEMYEWAVLSPGEVVSNGATGEFTSEQLKMSFGFEKIPIYIEN